MEAAWQRTSCSLSYPTRSSNSPGSGANFRPLLLSRLSTKDCYPTSCAAQFVVAVNGATTTSGLFDASWQSEVDVSIVSRMPPLTRGRVTRMMCSTIKRNRHVSLVGLEPRAHSRVFETTSELRMI